MTKQEEIQIKVVCLDKALAVRALSEEEVLEAAKAFYEWIVEESN